MISAALPVHRGLISDGVKFFRLLPLFSVNTFSLLWIQDLDNLIQDMDSDENKVSKSTVAGV